MSNSKTRMIVRQKPGPKKRTRPARRTSHSQPDKYDLIRDHILNDTPLPKEVQTFYNRATMCFSLLCQGHTEKEVVKLMAESNDFGSRMAYYIIRDTKKLFSIDPVGAHMAAEKKILIEMAKEAYTLAKQEKKPRDMVAATKLLAELIGVDDQDTSLVEMYDTLNLPDIIYTNDPEALYETEVQGEFKEVTDEEEIPA